jgi:hypothetical protein
MNLNESFILQTPEHLVFTIYSIFFALNMIKIGHPFGKSYSDDICTHVYPKGVDLNECGIQLKNALQYHRQIHHISTAEDDDDSINNEKENIFNSGLSFLNSAMEKMLLTDDIKGNRF